MKSRGTHNRILSYVDNGVQVDDFDKVVMHFLSQFKAFMKTDSPATSVVIPNVISLGNNLTVDQKIELIKPFSIAKIKEVMFQISSNKSPASDGFGSGFFKASWDIVKGDVCAAVTEFFNTCKSHKTFASTLLILVPKIDSPSHAKDFRPIACCSTIYKCISKLMCNRLRSFLPCLVHENQGAFVKGRSLAHNILILQDLIRHYSRKNMSAACFLKVDLRKAYDLVSWLFIENLLTSMAFPSKFINWIMACLSSAQYFLMLNGRIQGDFRGRGA